MTQRQRKQRRRRRHHTGRNSVLLGLGVLTVVAVIGVLAAVGYVLAIAATAPDLAELKPADKGQLSVVYAADGSRLGYIQSDVIRRVVAGRDIPVNTRRATVAIEDERFYKHGGVDFTAIVRAAFRNLNSGKTVQGGSTITMQLVRASTSDPKRDFARKIREAKLATELETSTPRPGCSSIPEHGAVRHGRRSLRDRHRGRCADVLQQARAEAHDRTSPRCSPVSRRRRPSTTRSGTRRPRSTRRNEVLLKMADNGYITQAEATRASQRGLGLKHGTRYIQRREPYFFDYVQEKLIERYGVGVVARGGLRSTRRSTRRCRKTRAKPINAYYADPARPELGHRGDRSRQREDPRDGLERTYASSNFNLAAQGHRQPGSAFKTFVLTAAIREGVDPDSTTTRRSRSTSTTRRTGTGRSRPSGTATSARSASRARRCHRTTRSTRS